ncbi:MAG: anti-sigma factor antagonist [Clostridia bacterium]|nr:anti-sigma factor antagonist [Clostridia bacterium]
MLQYKPVGESVTVVIAGELDHCAAPQIRHMLDDLIRDPGVTDMVLDLENLTFMDSSGIGVLLGRLRILQSRGGTLSVKNMQPSVEKLFRLSGLHRVIGIAEGDRNRTTKRGGRL